MLIYCLLIGTWVGLLRATPRFLSPADQTVSVKEGGTARLTCAYENKDENHAVMWQRDNGEGHVLFVDSDPLGVDDRLKLDPNEHALIIDMAEPADSGDYLCIITSDPQITLKRTLRVQVPPSVNIVPEQQTLILKPSQPYLQLTCYGSGNPVPQIVWRKLEGSLPGGNSTSPGQTLSISTAQYTPSDMEGQYECTASNGVEPPATKHIKVVIHFMPKVRADKTVFVERIGGSVNISCEFSGKPAPQVAWYHNGYPVQTTSSGYAMFGSASQEWESSILNIRKLAVKDLGDYECKVQNVMGATKLNFQVASLPGPVTLVQASDSGMRAVSLKWFFESPFPPTKYKVAYRELGADVWLENYVDPDAAGRVAKGDRYEMNYLLEGLEPGTEYEVRVMAGNEHGYGSLPDRSLVVKTIGNEKQSTSAAKTDPPSTIKGGAQLRTSWPLVIGSFLAFLLTRTFAISQSSSSYHSSDRFNLVSFRAS